MVVEIRVTDAVQGMVFNISAWVLIVIEEGKIFGLSEEPIKRDVFLS